MPAGYLLYTVRGVFPPFILAGFISYVLEHPVSVVQRIGVPRARAILLVYGILLLALVLFVVYFIPAFARDIRGLAGQVPALINLVQQYSATVRDTVIRYNLPAGLERGVIKALQRAETFLADIGDNVFSYFLSSATVVSYIVVAPVIAYHILKDINRWRQRALVYLARYQLPYVDLLRDVDQVLTGFVRGQTIVATMVGSSVWIGMTVLGVKFAAALGLLVGIGEFIPFFGPIVAGSLVLVLSFMKSPATGFWALALLLAIQWVDANIIVPRVTGPRVGLHPIWILFALLAGGELLGFWGLFLAIPAAGIVGALIKFGRAMYARL